jgi:hypothetical protein
MKIEYENVTVDLHIEGGQEWLKSEGDEFLISKVQIIYSADEVTAGTRRWRVEWVQLSGPAIKRNGELGVRTRYHWFDPSGSGNRAWDAMPVWLKYLVDRYTPLAPPLRNEDLAVLQH